jgi:hypothetical protein
MTMRIDPDVRRAKFSSAIAAGLMKKSSGALAKRLRVHSRSITAAQLDHALMLDAHPSSAVISSS